MAVGPDGQPLRFDALPAAAAAALWADVTATPAKPLPRSLVLDAAAHGTIPLQVPWTWVEACCHVWPPGGTGLGPTAAVLLSLAAARRHSTGTPSSALALLDRFAGPVLSHVLLDLGLLADAYRGRRRRRLDDEVRMLCRCADAGVAADAIEPFVDHGGVDLLRAAVEECPDQLAEVARRFGSYLTEWAGGGGSVGAWMVRGHWATGWCRALVRLGPGLVDRLVRDVGAVLPAGAVATLVNRLGWELDAVPDERRPAAHAVLSAAVPALVRRLATTAVEDERHEIVKRFEAAVDVAEAAAAAALPAGIDARDLFAGLFAATAGGGVGWFVSHQNHRDRAVVAAVARGRVDRLLAVSQLPVDPEVGDQLFADDLAQLAAGWLLLCGIGPGVAEAASAAIGRPGMTLRGVRAVVRLGLCLRFHRGVDLRAALADVAGTAVGDPVAELVRWRGEVPRRVREIVGRPAALARELAGLGGRTDAGADRRAAHLRRQLADPAVVAAWVQRDLDKILPASLAEARLGRFEAVADAAVRGHFADVLGVTLPAGLSDRSRRDWDNALRLYLTVDHNRPRLRQLLRRESVGDRAWLASDPPNAAFLAGVARAGVDPAVWRGPMVRHVTDAGGRPLRVELETEPLHVLQMGNYFGTCLSEGQMNAFSTVANATDANKRVAYAYDGRGTVVGRKLLAMTPAGQVVGFRTYGTFDHADAPYPAAAGRPELKAVFDAFCGELARRCGATLHPYAPRSHPAPTSAELTLAAAWYNDGAEPFDPAVLPTAPRRSRKARQRRAGIPE